MPHPHLAIEFAPDRVAAARWKGNSVDEFTVESLPPAALVPSAVEPNVINVSALKTAIANVVSRLREFQMPTCALTSSAWWSVYGRRRGNQEG